MDMTHLPAGPTTSAEPTDEETAELSAQAPLAPGQKDSEGFNITELEDGSALVDTGEEEAEPKESEFSENLAEDLIDQIELNRIGRDICDAIDGDKESRKQRDLQYAEGIKRTGLGGEAPGGADFAGASRVVHPMLAKGCVDFASKAIKELYPAAGPCKTQIIGTSSDAKLDKAERKKTYVNWQFTTQVQENRAEFERLLSQLPLGGSQYKRWWWDASLRRNRTETVYVDDVFLPYNQNDFYTSHRVTHRQFVSQVEFERRIDSGLYLDINQIAPASGMSNQSEARKATDKVEGAEEDSTAYNEEGLREIYQVYVDLTVEGDDYAADKRTAPYVLHVEAYSSKVLGLYRNWAEKDDTFAKKHWMVEYIFIPWRGAYGVGLSHLIGSLSAAATGALRALLDAAHISNFPGGLKLKGGRTAGQSIQVNATELAEIDAPPGVDDIRKLVMPFPFNGPSTVLQTLMEWLTQQAEGVVATASEKISEGGANMPMGTALALIEQGSVNFSAIHMRMHASLKKELEIVHRLNAENLTDEEVVEELGELVVSRADFQGPMDIIPISDPNIFSEAQRYAQLQAVMQLKTDPAFAPFFRADKLLERALKLLQFPSPEEIANLPKDPSNIDAIQENYVCASAEPAPLKVYDGQDDLAHLETHVHFMTSPMYGSNPLMGGAILPVLLKHCQEHLMAFYHKHAKAAGAAWKTVAQAQGHDLTDHQAQAKGSAFADMAMSQALGPLVMPGLAAAQATLKSLTPPPLADPNTQLQEQTKLAAKNLDLKAKQMELQYQSERDAADRTANSTAAQMAAAIEKYQADLTERLAKFSAMVDSVKSESSDQAKMAQLELQNQQEKGMAVLKEVLSQMTIQLQSSMANNQQPAAGPTISLPEKFGIDLGDQLKPLLQNLSDGSGAVSEDMQRLRDQAAQDQATMRGIINQLSEGMQNLSQSTEKLGTIHSQSQAQQAQHLTQQSETLAQLAHGVKTLANRPNRVKFDTDETGNITGGSLV